MLGSMGPTQVVKRTVMALFIIKIITFVIGMLWRAIRKFPRLICRGCKKKSHSSTPPAVEQETKKHRALRAISAKALRIAADRIS